MTDTWESTPLVEEVWRSTGQGATFTTVVRDGDVTVGGADIETITLPALAALATADDLTAGDLYYVTDLGMQAVALGVDSYVFVGILNLGAADPVPAGYVGAYARPGGGGSGGDYQPATAPYLGITPGTIPGMGTALIASDQTLPDATTYDGQRLTVQFAAAATLTCAGSDLIADGTGSPAATYTGEAGDLMLLVAADGTGFGMPAGVWSVIGNVNKLGRERQRIAPSPFIVVDASGGVSIPDKVTGVLVQTAGSITLPDITNHGLGQPITVITAGGDVTLLATGTDLMNFGQPVVVPDGSFLEVQPQDLSELAPGVLNWGPAFRSGAGVDLPPQAGSTEGQALLRTAGSPGYAWADLPEAQGVDYTPTTPADWTEGAPSEAGEALDTLAARAVGGGASAEPTFDLNVGDSVSQPGPFGSFASYTSQVGTWQWNAVRLPPGEYDLLSIYQTVDGDAVLRLCIDSVGADGRPGTLLQDCGTIDCSTLGGAGFIGATISPAFVVAEETWVWTRVACESGATTASTVNALSGQRQWPMWLGIPAMSSVGRLFGGFYCPGHSIGPGLEPDEGSGLFYYNSIGSPRTFMRRSA